MRHLACQHLSRTLRTYLSKIASWHPPHFGIEAVTFDAILVVFQKKKRKEKKQKFQNERRSKYPKERSLTFALLPIRNDKISIGCAGNDNGSESTTYKQLEPSSSQSIASQPLNHSDRSFSFEFTHIFFNYPNYPLYVKTWTTIETCLHFFFYAGYSILFRT